MSKKKWFTLSLVATALLLIPRRSSRQTLAATENNFKVTNPSLDKPDSNHSLTNTDKPSAEDK